jgi:short subunit dehydrogenase-like uncharacterized protein
MERIEQRYHETAAKNGCLVVSCCGFDSIPTDVGAAYAADVLASKGGLVRNIINSSVGVP